MGRVPVFALSKPTIPLPAYLPAGAASANLQPLRLILNLHHHPHPRRWRHENIIHQYFDFHRGIIDHCLLFSAVRKVYFYFFSLPLGDSPWVRPLLISAVCDTYTGAWGDEWSNPCGEGVKYYMVCSHM